MKKAIEHGGDGSGITQELAPLVNWSVGTEAGGRAFVPSHDQFEEVLGPSVQQLTIWNVNAIWTYAFLANPAARRVRNSRPSRLTRRQHNRQPENSFRNGHIFFFIHGAKVRRANRGSWGVATEFRNDDPERGTLCGGNPGTEMASSDGACPLGCRSSPRSMEAGMPASYLIHGARRLVYSRGWGDLQDTELLGHAAALRADSRFDPAFRQLVDFREVIAVRVSTEAVRGTAVHNPFRQDARRAFVVLSDEVFGMVRMFELYASADPEQFRIFRSMGTALAWVGLDPSSAWPTEPPDRTFEAP